MARRYKIRFRKKINIPRVVAKVAGVIIALYVGNEIINQIGAIVNCSSGPFNDGFKLIGWTITDGLTINASNASSQCYNVLTDATTYNNVVTDVSGAGVLAVIGVVGIASIVMEFVSFNM